MHRPGALLLFLVPPLAGSEVALPTFVGDPLAEPRLQENLAAALRATQAHGPWPSGPWSIRLHQDAIGFEKATGAPPARAGLWVGEVLHLRPWEQLRKRDLGALLRHELVHRRLSQAKLRPWAEEARCLWAETRTQPPKTWPAAPPEGTQTRLDQALRQGSTRQQAWAYRALRAWLNHQPLPPKPSAPPAADPWKKEALPLEEAALTVAWPALRMPRRLVVNGQTLLHRVGKRHVFQGSVQFGPESPVVQLDGRVELRGRSEGWELRWTCSPEVWVAAATAGELGKAAPVEAQRALAALLRRWLEGHRSGQHQDGSLCPLTHCAVVRGMPSPRLQTLVASAPLLTLDPRQALFCGSKGGVSLSTRAVWGWGPSEAFPVEEVPGDRWARWTRTLSPRQVQSIKGAVPPGLKPGQSGLLLGPSGPYAIESLRLEAGRRFGWTTWPSNACSAQLQGDGSLVIEGRGWGHNVGLCLSSAQHQAKAGRSAEVILSSTFGAEVIQKVAP